MGDSGDSGDGGGYTVLSILFLLSITMEHRSVAMAERRAARLAR